MAFSFPFTLRLSGLALGASLLACCPVAAQLVTTDLSAPHVVTAQVQRLEYDAGPVWALTYVYNAGMACADSANHQVRGHLRSGFWHTCRAMWVRPRVGLTLATARSYDEPRRFAYTAMQPGYINPFIHLLKTYAPPECRKIRLPWRSYAGLQLGAKLLPYRVTSVRDFANDSYVQAYWGVLTGVSLARRVDLAVNWYMVLAALPSQSAEAFRQNVGFRKVARYLDISGRYNVWRWEWEHWNNTPAMPAGSGITVDNARRDRALRYQTRMRQDSAAAERTRENRDTLNYRLNRAKLRLSLAEQRLANWRVLQLLLVEARADSAAARDTLNAVQARLGLVQTQLQSLEAQRRQSATAWRAVRHDVSPPDVRAARAPYQPENSIFIELGWKFFHHSYRGTNYPYVGAGIKLGFNDRKHRFP